MASPSQDKEEASIGEGDDKDHDIFELFIKSLDSTDSEEPEKLHRKSEEGTEMKISTSSEVPPDDLQKEHISSQFKRKHVTIQGEPKQDKPKGQDRQEKEANKGTPRSTGLQQKTHLKEVPATNLSGTLKTEDRLFNIGGVENEITEDMFRCMSPVSSSDCPTFDDLRLIFKNLKIDPVSQVEVMKMVWKYMCSLNNEKRHTEQMSCDISFLQTDKIDLQGNMERLKASFTEVESNLMQLQKENTNLKYRLQQHTTTEQVRDIKTQHQAGVQKKAKLEFSLRRVEEENIKLLNQHEREYNDVHSLATQEQCAREELQKQLDSCLRRQQELEEENSSNKRKCNKVLGQLTEASNKEKAMRQEIDALRDQLSTLKREGGLRENVLLEEKELFQEQLQDTVRNYKVGANALNKQIECLNSRLSDTKTLHENERVTRERLEAELKTIQCQLAEVEKKADLSHIAQSDIQRTLSQENERQEQLINNLKEKIINMQKKYNHLSQKLQQAKDSESDMEKKAKQLTQQLQENVLKQKVLQQEKDQADTDFIMREKNMQARICSLQDEKKEIKACLQKTEEELDETLKKLSMSEGAVEVSKQFQLELEEERSQLIRNLDTFEQQMEKDKDMHNVLMQEKNAVERRLHQEMTKASDLEKQNYRIQASLRNKRKKLQDLDNDQAESLRRMKDEISKMQHKLDIEGTIRSQMEQETNYLRDQLDQCARKNGELEKEALDLRYQMLILQSEHCGEIQWDHQQQQEQLKQFQQASPKLQDQKKTAKMDITNSEVEERFEKLENELSRVIESQDATQRELERSRQLYIQQVDTNRALERKLQRTKNRLTETSEMLFRQGPTCTTSHVS
ncbi:myosin-11-like [Takifugu rubripes]|uniref:myosin-11-like n=1 Tax=Takifugu rubripes TaxID=31033 RepID=UPI00114565BB|nr:myosin-11-like [Takifugu rubripes]